MLRTTGKEVARRQQSRWKQREASDDEPKPPRGEARLEQLDNPNQHWEGSHIVVWFEVSSLEHLSHLRSPLGSWAGSGIWGGRGGIRGTVGHIPSGSESEESACNSGDPGPIPGSGRSPGGGHGNPFQYSCLENRMDRGAWRATVHGVTNSQTWLKQLSTHTCILNANLHLQMSSTVFIQIWAAGECEVCDSSWL